MHAMALKANILSRSFFFFLYLRATLETCRTMSRPTHYQGSGSVPVPRSFAAMQLSRKVHTGRLIRPPVSRWGRTREVQQSARRYHASLSHFEDASTGASSCRSARRKRRQRDVEGDAVYCSARSGHYEARYRTTPSSTA
jgi:hypothetical protein